MQAWLLGSLLRGNKTNLHQKASVSEKESGLFLNRSHTNFTLTSHGLQRTFLFLLHQEEIPRKGGNDYVFRFGMVLVDHDSGRAGNLCPI